MTWITSRTLCWVKQTILRVIRSVDIESRMVVARGWGRKDRELKFNGYRISVLQNEKGSKDDWEWWSHSIVNVLHTINCSLKMVKMVNFMLHIFCHNFFKAGGGKMLLLIMHALEFPCFSFVCLVICLLVFSKVLILAIVGYYRIQAKC